MSNYKEISPYDLNKSAFQMIGKDWMLICAPDKTKACEINPMTASWGGVGIIWNKPVCTLYIRPQRYTYHIAEDAEYLSVCFPPEAERENMRFCGSRSGRDTDKASECNFGISEFSGVKYIDSSDIVFICKKLYADDLREESFTDLSPLVNYKQKDYHRFYICEILHVLVKE